MSFKMMLASAAGGAAIAVAAAYGIVSAGLLPSSTPAIPIRSYLLAHPGVVEAMSNEIQEKQVASAGRARQEAIDRLGLKVFFDPKIAFITGPAHAKTTFVEFFDYNCPYCRASHDAVEKVYEAHKANARFAFIEFPIEGPDSTAAARLAIAARDQPDRYLAYHFAMMHQDAPVTEQLALAVAKKVGLNLPLLEKDAQAQSVSVAIANARALAVAVGIDGTPVFVVDGKIREGAVTQGLLEQMLGGGGRRVL